MDWSLSVTIPERAAARTAVPRRLLAFVACTHLAGLVNLCRSTDGLVEETPHDGEAALNRGFHLSNRCVNGSMGPTEERRGLVDTEQCVCVELKAKSTSLR